MDDEVEQGSPVDSPARESLAARLISETKGSPDVIADRLGSADETSQARTLQVLQRHQGNAFVESVVRRLVAGRTTREIAAGSGGGAGIGRGDTMTLERDVGDEALEEDIPAEEPVAEAEVDFPEGATETVGPETSSFYPVAATSLEDVSNQISGRDEAGHCGWVESMDFRQTGGKITAIVVTVTIDVEMPSWTPPPSMLPKAKAEWDRWYAALLAHEAGHVKLVHDHFDGLASEILGKSPRKGRNLFNNAKAALSKASKAYDKKSGHGTKAGTIIDTGIESREIDEKKKEDEAKKKQEEAEKGGKKAEVEGVPQADLPA
jgi:hypothetical protein